MADHETIGAVLKVLVKAYPGRFEVDADTASVYAQLLGDLPNEALKAAALHHASMSKWPPSIAELREAAHNLMASPAERLTAGEAWDMVIGSIRRARMGDNGAMAYPTDDLPDVVQRAIRAMGGMRDIAMSTNGMADRAHFLKIFVQLQERENERARMLPAVAKFQAEYRLGTGDVEPPALADRVADDDAA